jgi:hypothetical protein
MIMEADQIELSDEELAERRKRRRLAIHAFPQDERRDIGGGMRLRDYFAAMALHRLEPMGNGFEALAKQAYQLADAMMMARETM